VRMHVISVEERLQERAAEAACAELVASRLAARAVVSGGLTTSDAATRTGRGGLHAAAAGLNSETRRWRVESRSSLS